MFARETEACFEPVLRGVTRSAVIVVLLTGCSLAFAEEELSLQFHPNGQQYDFDTGQLRGTLRQEGQSLGLLPVIDTTSGTSIAHSKGLFSHYRLLDAENRYGHGGWDWDSASHLGADGSVHANWSADEGHPFDMSAVYRWSGPGTLDVTTSVVPKKDLRNLEVFLASYLDGFSQSYVYVGACPETGGKAGFLEARREIADWQMFPRDQRAVRVIGDGRWQRLPHPVDWKIMPRMAAPLAIRRDLQRNLTALVMAPPEDCFAVATPFGADGHRSLYLSLIGRDLAAGTAVTVRSRLVIGRDISDQQAISLYQAYLKELE
jgi:hypothetical protein